MKDMPGHLLGREADLSYVPEYATHTFLIRHPVKTINSFIKLVVKAVEILIPGARS